jgi:hypothetical protein
MGRSANVDGSTVEAKSGGYSQPLESAQLLSVPTTTGHELLDAAGNEKGRPLAPNIGVKPVTPMCWLSGACDFHNTSYFSLYGRLRGKGQRLLLAVAVVLSGAAGVPLPVIGFLFGKIINSFPPPEDEIRARLGQLIAVALAYFVITWGWAFCWGAIGETISQDLRQALVEKLLGMVRVLIKSSQILSPKSFTVYLIKGSVKVYMGRSHEVKEDLGLSYATLTFHK